MPIVLEGGDRHIGTEDRQISRLYETLKVIKASEKHGATQQHRYSHTNDRELG